VLLVVVAVVVVVVVAVVAVSPFIFTKAKKLHSFFEVHYITAKTNHILALSNGCHQKYKNGRVKVDLG